MTLQQQSQPQRPPVPLFPGPAEAGPGLAKMESVHSLEGNDANPIANFPHRRSELTGNLLDVAAHLLDFSNHQDMTSPGHSVDLTLFDAVSVDGPLNMSLLDSVSPLEGTQPQTVSPHELMTDSAPASANTTNLSTPGTLPFESPGMAYSNETSPLFQNDEVDEDDESWPSLFPPGETHDAQQPTDIIAPVMQRSESTPSQSGRHSSINGVRSRRREKPLPLLDYSAERDPAARKRMKNTEAARKSRAKKQERVELMQERIDELEAEVAHYKVLCAQLQPG